MSMSMTTVNNCLWLITNRRTASLSSILAALSLAVTVLCGSSAFASEAISPAGQASDTAKASTRVRLRGGRMQTQLQDGKMVLTGFQGGFAGGQVQMSGHLNSAAPAGEGQGLDVRFAGLSVDRLVSFAFPGLRLPTLPNAKITGQAKGEWSGAELNSAASTLQGTFDITLSQTALSDAGLLAKLASATGIPELKAVLVDGGRMTGTAQNGIVQLHSLTLSGPDFQMAAAGTVDLNQNEMNLSADVSVAHELAQQSAFYKVKNVIAFFKGNAGNDGAQASAEPVKLPKLTVVGSLTQPRFEFAGQQVASATSAAVQPTVAAPVAANEKPGAAAVVSSAKKFFSLASAVQANEAK